jgi:hypothetical protein
MGIRRTAVMKKSLKKTTKLPWEDWVIVSHELNETDKSPWFRVAMHGYPPDNGKKAKLRW